MSGIANRLFIEKGWESLVKATEGADCWPRVQSYIDDGIFLYSDKAFAAYLFKGARVEDENQALFICHLMLSARKGHLCVHVDGVMNPDPRLDWLKDQREGVYEEILESISHLSDDILCQKEDEHYPLKPLCKRSGHYYLQRYWVYEALFKRHLERLAFESDFSAYDSEIVNVLVEKMERSGLLLKEQAQAIILSSQQALTVITGGPGTGKTYTAACLIRVLAEAKKEKGFQIVLNSSNWQSG